jgi:hypothetical protein
VNFLESYIWGYTTYKDFIEQFAPWSWDNEEQWVSTIKLYWFELTSGHRTEEEFKTLVTNVYYAELYIMMEAGC